MHNQINLISPRECKGLKPDLKNQLIDIFVLSKNINSCLVLYSKSYKY